MRTIRRISLPAHGLVELVAGLALVVAALGLDLGGAGTVLTFAAGVALAGIGLGSGENLPLVVHQELDRWLTVALAVGSVIAAVNDGVLAAVVLLATAIGLFALHSATRWTRPATY